MTHLKRASLCLEAVRKWAVSGDYRELSAADTK